MYGQNNKFDFIKTKGFCSTKNVTDQANIDITNLKKKYFKNILKKNV